MAKKFPALCLAFILVSLVSQAFAANEVQVEKLTLKKDPPDRYEISATVHNKSKERREVVLRAQVFFYDETSPAGDIPVMILRKDETVYLNRGEGRRIEFRLINEGTLPKVRMRLEPEVRIRRQRVWQY
jgi:hypothetical protein